MDIWRLDIWGMGHLDGVEVSQLVGAPLGGAHDRVVVPVGGGTTRVVL